MPTVHRGAPSQFAMLLCLAASLLACSDRRIVNEKVETRLNVREHPSTDQAVVVGKLYRGQKVLVVSTTDGWFNVSLPNGVQGWAKAEFLSEVSADIQSELKLLLATWGTRESLLSAGILLSVAAFGVSFASARTAAVGLRGRAFLDLRSRFSQVRGSLTGVKLIEKIEPCKKQAARDYVALAFDEWFITQWLDRKRGFYKQKRNRLGGLWSDYYESSIKSQLGEAVITEIEGMTLDTPADREFAKIMSELRTARIEEAFADLTRTIDSNLLQAIRANDTAGLLPYLDDTDKVANALSICAYENHSEILDYLLQECKEKIKEEHLKYGKVPPLASATVKENDQVRRTIEQALEERESG